MDPKLQVLVKIANALNAKGVRWAVGGSALLFLKGIVFSFNDLDISVMLEDSQKAREALKEIGDYHSSERLSKSKVFDEFTIDGVDVDLVSGMILESYGKEYDVSFKNENVEHMELEGADIILDSLEAWYEIYNLQGRSEKARYIKDYLLYHK